jgi:diguanylate cyclase (GGDEF)-like protein/PAS domain S-box-containing protein
MPGVDDPEILRRILDCTLTGIYFVDRNGKVMLWNSAAERLTGYLRQNVVGHTSPADFLVATDENNRELTGNDAPSAIAMRDGKPDTREISFRHKAGHRIPARLHTVPLRNTESAIIGVVESLTEFIPIDDAYRRQSKLAQYGCIDRASGVLNHGMMHSHLRETIATYAEHPVPFSILCVAVSNISQIRARHGQGAIDSVLRVVAQTLEYSLRPTDFVGRWRESEFLTILTECDELEVHAVVDRIRRMVTQSKVEWWGDPVSITLAIGAASARSDDTEATMLERAESALQQCLGQTIS